MPSETATRKWRHPSYWVVHRCWSLIKDFIILLGIALIITAPINLYLMNRWLEDFAYDVPIQPFSFVAALIIALVLCGITIRYHIFKIAKADPVDSLRYE